MAVENKELSDIEAAMRVSGTLVDEQSDEQQEEEIEDSNIEDDDSTVDLESEKPKDVEDSEKDNDDSDDSDTDEEEDKDIIDLNSGVKSKDASKNNEESKEEQITQVKFSEILGGEFDSEEDLTGYIETLQTTITELESKKPTFANEFVEKLNEYVLNGGKASDFVKVQGIDVAKMNPFEILTTELLWTNPGLSEAKAKEYLMKKYQDAVDQDGNINMDDATISVHSVQAAKSLKEIQAKDNQLEVKGISEAEWKSKQKAEMLSTQEEIIKQNTSRMTEWFEPIDKAVDDIVKNGIVMPINETKGFKFAYTKDEAYTKSLVSRVDKALYDAGTSVKENPAYAKQMVEMLFKMDNFDDMAKAYGNKMANSKNKEWFEKTTNPSALKRGDKRDQNNNGPLSAEEAYRQSNLD